ncbi:hypothetical protein C8C77_12522 [Halanaerobium saccharolyticum]|uniref:DUF2357 domain-containing protein n=1 Tax=Halanaerobium saccharolyticum TaxID=43595 RepID=A0A4R7YSM8_9FIRM|nr:restriction endonuclease-like protein [Halanaerobium saccharolyticum]RAK06303.1 hypothetical protein C7958_12420 [Halanaerobium saccharolyticum]TDW00782.1 hypothetical protein C8C77_12522 [Halanaerobium saccharolyticum]TDX52424.1 hypothetical protein C7956_12422 [Halanaerobium saccharolyticum]
MAVKKIDLITIKNDKFSLNIKGKPLHPDHEKKFPERNKAQASYSFSSILEKGLDFKYYDPEIDQLKLSQFNSIKSYPLFFEYQNYDFHIEAETPIEIYHPNREIRESLSHPNDKPNVLYGSINFGSDIGYSEFEIRSNSQVILTLKLEVFPSKIDYQHDYNKLLEEVNKEVYNLAYDFLRKTYQEMKISEKQNITEAEFFAIIENIFEDLFKALKRIEESPHHQIIRKRNVRPASRVKKVGRQSLKWLNKNSRHYDQDLKLPEKMLAVEKKLSYDNFENKFIKWSFSELIKRLKHFKVNYSKSKSNPDQNFLAEIDKMIRKLKLKLKHSFLAEVGELQKIDSISLVLQMAPGYKELYKYYLMLLKGLSLNGDIFRLSIKQLWQLYEYWTFLKLNRLLQDKYKLIKNNIIDLDYSGINVTLSQGAAAEVEYQNPITGEKFKLSYNRSSGDGITTNQKPDNILSLSKNDSEHQYKFIFDAKYRLNNAEEGTRYGDRYEGIPGPEESDINTMHRYRDAVAAEMGENYRRTMVGAYVLFPYHDQEKFKKHKFYKSIEQVNIGAFPFLPGSTELLAEFLENIIDESAQSNFDRNLMPAAADEFRPQPEFKVDLLLGSLRSKKQFEYLLANNLYYLPLQQSVLNHNLEYVAIFQSKAKFGEQSGVRYYGRIKNKKIVKREEIDFPSSRKNIGQNYLLFDVESWQQLGKKIKSEGYGVSSSHIYSNLMLLKKADTLPELSIRSLKEWRLWLELKRLKEDIKLQLKNNNLDQIQKIEGFRAGKAKIKLKEDILQVELKENQLEFSYSEFIQNPRSVLNKIMELINDSSQH